MNENGITPRAINHTLFISNPLRLTFARSLAAVTPGGDAANNPRSTHADDVRTRSGKRTVRPLARPWEVRSEKACRIARPGTRRVTRLSPMCSFTSMGLLVLLSERRL